MRHDLPTKTRLTRFSILAAGLLCMVVVDLAHTQPSLETPVAPTAALEIDWETLLLSPHAFPAAIDDPIWSVSPSVGNRLVQIPLRVATTGTESAVLQTNTLRLARGRLLCWRIGDYDQRSARPIAARTNSSRSTGFTPRSQRDTDGESDGESSYGGYYATSTTRAPVAPNTFNLDPANPHPLITRSVTVHPDGRATWSMDRTLLGGTVKDVNQAYALLIDRQLLDQRNPGPAPRIVRQSNEDSRAFSARRQQELAQYRVSAKAYIELNKQLRQLPKDFVSNDAPRLWAIFELNDSADSLTIDGLIGNTWQISLLQLESLRTIAVQPLPPPEQNALPQTANDAVQLLTQLTADGQTSHLRLAAHTLAHAQFASHARAGSITYRLFESLLHCSDAATRRIVLDAIVSTPNPTPDTARLSSLAMNDPDPIVQLISLKGAIRAGMNNPVVMQQTLGVFNRALADPAGPPPAQVLALLLSVSRQQPELIPVMANAVQLELLTTDRLQETAAFIVTQAGQDPLAASWLNYKLLGSTDTRSVLITLLLLSEADSTEQPSSPFLTQMLNLLFGPPIPLEPQTKLRISISQRIALDSNAHAMFRALQHSDAQIRQSAWRALRQFVISETAAPPTESDPSLDPRFQHLLDAALTYPPPPTQLVAFLAKQSDPVQTTICLCKLAISPEPALATQAIRQLIGVDRPVDRGLKTLTADERHIFGKRLYTESRGSPPLAVGLLREPIRDYDDDSALTWFSEQVRQGQIPTPNAWATSCSEERLIGHLPSSDPQLAVAAAAALIYSVGGTDSQAQQLMTKLREEPNQSRAYLHQKWLEYKAVFTPPTPDPKIARLDKSPD